MSYILILGNVVDGLEFVGPYKSPDDAVAAADLLDYMDWQVGELNDPNPDTVIPVSP